MSPRSILKTGAYETPTTKGISVKPDEVSFHRYYLLGDPFRSALGRPEFDDLAARYVAAAHKYHKWVGFSLPNLEERFMNDIGRHLPEYYRHHRKWEKHGRSARLPRQRENPYPDNHSILALEMMMRPAPGEFLSLVVESMESKDLLHRDKIKSDIVISPTQTLAEIIKAAQMRDASINNSATLVRRLEMLNRGPLR